MVRVRNEEVGDSGIHATQLQQDQGQELQLQSRPGWRQQGPCLSQPLAHSSAAWLHGCRLHACMDAWLHQAGPQPTTSLTNGWVDEARFAHRKALKCYAVPSWGFNHMLHENTPRVKDQILKQLGEVRQEESSLIYIKYKLKFLIITKRRNIPSEHLSKKEFDIQFNNLGYK